MNRAAEALSTAAPPTIAEAGSATPARVAASSRARRLHADAAAALALIGLAGYFAWDLLRDGTVVGMDTGTAFYPWFSFLGERLRAGHLPLWNPYQFSGTPFAADPESGWTYLAAMLLFTVLPLGAAANAYLVGHILLGGLGSYALGRALGLRVGGALVAAVAYSYSGFYFGHNLCCFAYASVAAWLPVSLLGVEYSSRADTWRARAVGWGLAGLAISQILAMWLGQGAYYALLVIGAYVAYRTLLGSAPSLRQRLANLALHGGAVLIVGFGLSGAGLLPRLEYNALSNLPGGYAAMTETVARAGPLDWGIIEDWRTRLLEPGFHYMGWTVLALAILAPFVARARMGVPFFAAMAVATLIVARSSPTPLHTLLSVLPAFERTHAHAPERALIVFFLAPAILAGATVSVISAGRLWSRVAVSGLIMFLVLVDLRLAWRTQYADSLVAIGAYDLKPLDLEAYYAPGSAGRFLQSVDEPFTFRYVSYAGHVFGGPIAYTLGWSNPETVALEVNNRALISGLHDVQGYNPIHLARYDRYLEALNGAEQDYHNADVYEAGLDSPLLDLLAVRYVVVPSAPAADQRIPHFERPLTTVFEDGDVRIMENHSALPRAWLVHSAEQVVGDAALALLASGQVNPRETALLEEPPPSLGPPSDDRVQIIAYEPERIELETNASAESLLVLGEIYDPAWAAHVDGAAAHVYVADGALRALVVPPGAHRVELRYEPLRVRIGILMTVGTVLALVCIIAFARSSTRP